MGVNGIPSPGVNKGEHVEEAQSREAQKDVEHNWREVRLTMREQQRSR